MNNLRIILQQLETEKRLKIHMTFTDFCVR